MNTRHPRIAAVGAGPRQMYIPPRAIEVALVRVECESSS